MLRLREIFLGMQLHISNLLSDIAVNNSYIPPVQVPLLTKSQFVAVATSGVVREAPLWNGVGNIFNIFLYTVNDTVVAIITREGRNFNCMTKILIETVVFIFTIFFIKFIVIIIIVIWKCAEIIWPLVFVFPLKNVNLVTKTWLIYWLVALSGFDT